MVLWQETPTSSSSPQAFRMRVTVSSAKSLRLAKETNKKIPVTAGAVRALLPSAFFFALPLVTGGRTCWAVAGREEYEGLNRFRLSDCVQEGLKLSFTPVL